MERTKLRITKFFIGYFKNFHKILFSNFLFAVPLVVFSLIFYFINTLSGLNLSFIALLPVIFIFPFFAGITLITRNIVKEDAEIPVLKLFFKGIKENFLYFLIHGIVLYCAVFFCYTSITLYWNLAHSNGIFYFAFGIAIIITILLLFIFYNISVMTVTFDLSLKNIYKNCALMAFGELKNNFFCTLGLFLLFIVCATVFFAAPNVIVLITVMIAVIIFIVPSTASYIMNFYVYEDMESIITDSASKSNEIQQQIKEVRENHGGSVTENEKVDFSNLDLDETKDGDEYLYFNGKMIKRRVLIDMKKKQESMNE